MADLSLDTRTPGHKRKRPPAKECPTEPSSEKRLRRYRTSPPKAFEVIWERAITQRFVVLERSRTEKDGVPEEVVQLAGTTGNVYTVSVNTIPSCNCPYALKGNQCKHMIYVLHRVLRAPYEYVYQLALLPSELRAIFAAAPPIQPALNILPTSLSQTAGEQLSSAEEVTRPMTTLTGLRRKPIEPDSDCPICYDALSAQESTIWCRAQCGSNMHAACFATWAAEVRKRRTGAAEVSCPYCRAHWVDDNPTVKGRAAAGRGSGGRRLDDVAVDDLVEVSEGYVNVARELGISGVRDTSTYSPWLRYHRRRRGYEEEVDDEDW